jgi:chromosome segregation ATPase
MNFKDKVNAVHSEVQELQNELGIPDSYMNEIFEMLEGLRNEKVMSVQETIDDYINRRVEEAVSTKLHDVFSKITTIEDSIRCMDIDHIESEIANLDDRADTFESEIYDLQNDVTCIEDKLADHSEDPTGADLDKRVTRLEEDLLQFDDNVVESKIREAIGNLKVQLKVREV